MKNAAIAWTGLSLGIPNKSRSAHMINKRKKHILKLPVQYYQNARIYGPGMHCSGVEGLHEKTNRETTQPRWISVGSFMEFR